MGIINASPESFFKGSIRQGYDDIASTASKMEEEGASIIDVGAMSTAPYLDTMISLDEEIARIKVAIKAVKEACSSKVMVSIDTPRAEAASEALRLGADMVNDVTGLKYDPSMASIVRDYDAYIILSAYNANKVHGSIDDTINALRDSIGIARNEGIDDEKMIIDPAIGFFRNKGKNPFFTRIDKDWFARDLEMLNNLARLKEFKKPICVSVSRKSFIGKVLGIEDPSERLYGSLAAEAIAIMNGADIIRTHNVKESMQVAKVVEAISMA